VKTWLLVSWIPVFGAEPTAAQEAVRAQASPAHAAPVLDRSSPAGGIDFVADASCLPCHSRQADLFRGSHHDLAMQPATRETVLGDFDDTRFEYFGVETRFFRRDGQFMTRTEGPGGESAEYVIAYTFGVEPLQQYLVHFPGGRLQALPVAWDVERERWFHLYPDERIGADDPLHWTGRYQTWNAMCAECHSTNLRKRYDPATDGYRTTWAEIDVGCQACHGPGAAHMSWARAKRDGAEEESRDSTPGHEGIGLVASLARVDSRTEVDACARCHARRHRVSGEDAHGRPLLDDFMPATLDAHLYYADGQILDEVYVYGSFVQSRMYAAGVRCSDCHDPHSLSLRAEGDALCTQCHRPEPQSRFDGLIARRYDTAAHHHHPVESKGARCVSCHMPARTYMVIDPRRDHSLRVPRPDLSQKLGVPNACNGCHGDQSSSWAVSQVEAWYGPERRRGADYGTAIHDGRAGGSHALQPLLSLLGSDLDAGIVRATSVSLLPRYGAGALAELVEATRDPDPLVRALAARSLALLPPAERPAVLAPLLDDPIRAVRIEAAAQLAASLGADPALARRPELRRALDEYEAAQRATSDLPGGRLNLGVLYTALGRMTDAEREYLRATELDPTFLPAYANLSQLYDRIGRAGDAESVLRAGIAHCAEPAELHYSLGLLLAAQPGRMSESVRELRAAARGLPDRARVHYNLGLAEQHLGHPDRAATALKSATRIDPREPGYPHALALLYSQQKDFEKAVVYARRLVELAPDSLEARQLLATLERERARMTYSGADP